MHFKYVLVNFDKHIHTCDLNITQDTEYCGHPKIFLHVTPLLTFTLPTLNVIYTLNFSLQVNFMS